MKFVMAICLLLIIVVPPIPGQTSDQTAHKSGNPKGGGNGSQQPTQGVVTPAIIKPDAAKNPKDEGANEKKQNGPITISTAKPLDISADVSKDWMDWIAWGLNCLLVAAAVLGVLYARRTLNAIKGQLAEMKAAGQQTDKMIMHANTQAIAAKDAAAAAFLGAQSVIDAERPWFVPSIERDEGEAGLWRVRITNKGSTPGHLWEMFTEHIFVDLPANLPLPPTYQTPTFRPDSSFIAKDESFTDRERIPGFNPVHMRTQAVEQGRINQFGFLVVYGMVTYRDTFTGRKTNEVLHETRWCYIYQRDRPELR